jgi:hypothetical protein
MLQPLKNPSKARTKELAVSAIGAIGESEDQGGKSVASPRVCVRQTPGLAASDCVLSGPAATAAQDSLLPYFPTIMDLLREFLLTGHEDFHLVQIQSLGKAAVTWC